MVHRQLGAAVFAPCSLPSQKFWPSCGVCVRQRRWGRGGTSLSWDDGGRDLGTGSPNVLYLDHSHPILNSSRNHGSSSLHSFFMYSLNKHPGDTYSHRLVPDQKEGTCSQWQSQDPSSPSKGIQMTSALPNRPWLYSIACYPRHGPDVATFCPFNSTIHLSTLVAGKGTRLWGLGSSPGFFHSPSRPP